MKSASTFLLLSVLGLLVIAAEATEEGKAATSADPTPSKECWAAIHSHKEWYFWSLFGRDGHGAPAGTDGERILKDCGEAYGNQRKLEMMMYMRGVGLVQSWSVEGKGVDCNRALNNLIDQYFILRSNPAVLADQISDFGNTREQARSICKQRFRYDNEYNGFQYVLDKILVLEKPADSADNLADL